MADDPKTNPTPPPVGKDWCGPDWSRIGPADPRGHIPRDWRDEWKEPARDQ